MEDEGYGFIEEEINEIVHRYEQMRKRNENYFFDVVEFETIIDYYLEKNDVSYAFEAAESASVQHPASASIRLRKAKVFIDKGRAVDALKIVKIIEKFEADNFEVYLIKGAALGMLGDQQGIRKYFDIALSIDEAERVNILLSITSILGNLNHYHLLIPYLEQLIELEPEYYTHLYDLAYAYEKSDNISKSIEYYVLYLDYEPFSDNAWYNLGLLYNKNGMEEEALSAYDYALAVNPDNYFALFNKGNLLSTAGLYNDAIEAYLEYLEYEDENVEALTYAGECYHKTGDKLKALKFYQQAIDLDPDFPDPWFGIAMVWLSDKAGDSIMYFKKAVSLDPENNEYWYYLSKAQFIIDQKKESFRSMIKSLKLDPFFDMAWVDMGEMIISEGLHNHSAVLLSKGLRVLGDIHGLRYVLASIYLHQQKPDLCFHHLEKALKEAADEYSLFEKLFPEKLLGQELEILINERKKNE